MTHDNQPDDTASPPADPPLIHPSYGVLHLSMNQQRQYPVSMVGSLNKHTDIVTITLLEGKLVRDGEGDYQHDGFIPQTMLFRVALTQTQFASLITGGTPYTPCTIQRAPEVPTEAVAVPEPPAPVLPPSLSHLLAEYREVVRGRTASLSAEGSRLLARLPTSLSHRVRRDIQKTLNAIGSATLADMDRALHRMSTTIDAYRTGQIRDHEARNVLRGEK